MVWNLVFEGLFVWIQIHACTWLKKNEDPRWIYQKCSPNNLPFNGKWFKRRWEMNTQLHHPCNSNPRKGMPNGIAMRACWHHHEEWSCIWIGWLTIPKFVLSCTIHASRPMEQNCRNDWLLFFLIEATSNQNRGTSKRLK